MMHRPIEELAKKLRIRMAPDVLERAFLHSSYVNEVGDPRGSNERLEFLGDAVIDLAVTSHEGKGFQVVPWRWAVERTFAWLLTDRRHSRDYERLTTNSEAMIQLSMIRLLLKRLA